MPYRIDLPPRVAKTLDKLEQGIYKRLESAIDELTHNPRPRGAKKLGGSIYRIRKGNWRIIYAVFDTERIVQLIRAARRSEKIYKKLP